MSKQISRDPPLCWCDGPICVWRLAGKACKELGPNPNPNIKLAIYDPENDPKGAAKADKYLQNKSDELDLNWLERHMKGHPSYDKIMIAVTLARKQLTGN